MISKQYNDDEALLAMHIGVIAFTVNCHLSTVGIHEYSILSAAFLCGYLYGDTLTSDQVTYQLYTAHAVMIYTG